MRANDPNSQPRGCAVLASIGLAVCAASAAAASDQEDLAPRSAQGVAANASPIGSITAMGDGCPQGSWRAAWSDDGHDVLVRFEDLGGAVSSSIDSEDSKSCTLILTMNGRDGVSYAPATVSVSGTSQSSLSLFGAMHWNDAPQERKLFETSGPGNVNGSFAGGDLWSPCSGRRELRIALGATQRARRDQRGMFGMSQARIKMASRACDQHPQAAPMAPASTRSLLSATSIHTIKSVSLTGDCQPENSSVSFDPSAKTFEVDFNVTAAGELASCGIVTTLDVPPGKRVAIRTVPLAGELDVADGAFAGVMVVADAFEEVRPPMMGRPFAGPRREAFSFEQELNYLGPTPCGSGIGKVLRLTVAPSVKTTTVVPRPSSVTIRHVGPVKFMELNCP